MNGIQILLQYNGEWGVDYNYQNYSLDGIVVPQQCSYSTLVHTIKKQLSRFSLDGSMEIEYKLKEGLRPMLIYNDMSVKFYLDQRRTSDDVTRYPLCVTFKEQPNTMVVATAGSVIPVPSNREIAIRESDLYMAPNDYMLIGSDCEATDDILVDEIYVICDPSHNDVAVGQVYKDKETLVSVMKNLALRNNFQFRVDRSCSTRYSIICAGRECDWSLQSSSLSNSKVFKIRHYNNEHTCPENERLISQRNASYAMIGKLIKEKFKDPKRVYTPNDIIQDIKDDYGFELNYMKAWRSKEKAQELLRGDPSKSYGVLPSYLYMLKQTNPGTVTKLHTTADGRFMYVYVALFASIKSWEYCKPVVVVDGCFLSATFGGTLVTASTQDGDGSIVPLAYAVVDSENDKSWEWFFEALTETYGVRDGMCIVSDRCASIARACSINYPEVPHCICIYHLWNNVKVKFARSHKLIGDIFFSLAKAYTVEEFDYWMGEVEQIDSRVKQYLFDVGYHRWSRAHAEANRFDIMTSNIAESINGINRHARKILPLVSLLENLRSMVRKWNSKNRKAAMGTYKVLTNKNHEIMKRNLKASLRMTVIPSTDYLYEVHEGEKQHVICLHNRTCSCRKFQIDEMPCSHAHAVLKYNNIVPEDFCSPFYTKENLVRTYEVPVYPMMDQNSWSIPEEILEEVVLPPKGSKQAGRPKKRRRRSAWELVGNKSKISCGRCGQQGHNKKTCRNRPVTS